MASLFGSIRNPFQHQNSNEIWYIIKRAPID